MENKVLADMLDNIALSKSWHGDALVAAAEHDAVTFYDRIVIRRYQHGIAKATDHISLQEIAMKIRNAN